MSSDDIPSNGVESPRPQADPLPSKRGEIGYIEAAAPPIDILHTLNEHDLPTRHSFDRNRSPVAVIPPAQSEDVSCPSIVSSPSIVSCPSSDQLSTTASITKSNGMLDFFKPQGPPAFGGIRLYTLVIFAVQLSLLGGTVVIWVLVSKRRAITGKEKDHQTPFEQSTIIPVHIVFIVVILVQLVLLERLFFRLREERYGFVHHGETLPRDRDIPRSAAESSMTLAFAPWNHPSLPTYAAALSQSGVATGDVEDHLIAGSPPPAYDNTRGSTSVFPRNSLGRESGTGRLSYVSRDEQRVQVQNAESLRRLEETMDRLEPPPVVYIAR